MDIDALALPHLGITLPSLETLGPQGYPGFESEGDEALQWWRRLREVSDQSGWWPVLLDYHTGALASAAPPPAGPRPIRPDAGDAELPVVDDPAPDLLDKELENWPVETGERRADTFHLPFETWTQEPKPVMVTLLPVAHGWEVPRLIGYGGWNGCPPPQAHAAILKRWHERYGAELVCLTRTGLELRLVRPPMTRAQALALAWDYTSYCHDGCDAIYQADTLARLAAALLDAEVVRCWWD